jgi:hypothetical protein
MAEKVLLIRVNYTIDKCLWRTLMFDQCIDDIDYENLDDLPLFDRIDWRFCFTASANTDQQRGMELETV